jgi:hypothetical protein
MLAERGEKLMLQYAVTLRNRAVHKVDRVKTLLVAALSLMPKHSKLREKLRKSLLQEPLQTM